MNPKKELLWGLWVELSVQVWQSSRSRQAAPKKKAKKKPKQAAKVRG